MFHGEISVDAYFPSFRRASLAPQGDPPRISHLGSPGWSYRERNLILLFLFHFDRIILARWGQKERKVQAAPLLVDINEYSSVASSTWSQPGLCSSVHAEARPP